MTTSVMDVLISSWHVILAAGLICAILTFFVATQMSRAYRAEAVVALLTDSGRTDLLAALGGQLGGLGALAGLGVGGNVDRNERIAVLTSRDLARKFRDGHALVDELCAGKAIKCAPGRAKGEPPTESEANQAVKKFLRRVLTVTEDKRTGLVRVSITWHDRRVAAQWANEYVALANQELLAQSVAESNRRIEFLRDAADKAQSVELREAVYHVMESEIESIMLATTRSDYAFRVVDPAVSPDERDVVRPRKALLAIAGAVLGSLAAMAVVLLMARRRVRSERTGAQS